MSKINLNRIVTNVITESEDEFGYVFGHSGSLYDIFVKPVTDAGKVASAEMKKTAARGKHLVHTAAEAIISTLLPFLDADYDKIDATAQHKIEQAEAQAGDAYDEIKRAVGGSDAVMFSLLYAPAAMITLAAGNKITDKLKKAFGLKEGVHADDPRLRDLSSSVRAATHEKLKSFASLAGKIRSAKDAAELASVMGNKLKGQNSSDVAAVKQKLINALAKKISDERDDMIKHGVPKAAPIVKDYDKTVSLILGDGNKNARSSQR